MFLAAAPIRDFHGKAFCQNAGADPCALWRKDDGHASLVARALAALSARAGTDCRKGEGIGPVGDVVLRPVSFLEEADALRRQLSLNDCFGVKICRGVGIPEPPHVPGEEPR